MGVKLQTETRRGVVNANAMFNSSLNYSLNWQCLMTKAKSSNVESQISLEFMKHIRNQVDGKYDKTYAREDTRKKARLLIVL
jgi:hypothetical protein